MTEVLTREDMRTCIKVLERHGHDLLANTFRAVMNSTRDGWATLSGLDCGEPTPRPPVGGSAATSVDSLGV